VSLLCKPYRHKSRSWRGRTVGRIRSVVALIERFARTAEVGGLDVIGENFMRRYGAKALTEGNREAEIDRDGGGRQRSPMRRQETASRYQRAAKRSLFLPRDL